MANPDGPEKFPRRTFLKLAAGIVGGAFFAACDPRNYEALPLYRQPYCPEAVIYKGRLTSLSDLPSNVKNHLTSVNQVLNRVIENAGQGIRQPNPNGYLGGELTGDWQLDPAKKTIMVDETNEGRLITQVYIGRIMPSQVSGGFEWGPYLTAKAYNKKSLFLVVEGNEENPLWFDNVESEDGKNTIRVNVKNGKVYQIHVVDEPNIFERWWKQKQTEINITSLDLTRYDNTFRPAETVFSPRFMKVIYEFIEGLKQLINNEYSEYSDEDRINFLNLFFDHLYPKLFFSNLSEEQKIAALLEINNFFGLSGELQDWQSNLISELSQIDLDVPIDLKTSMILAETVKFILDSLLNKNFNQNDQSGIRQFFNDLIEHVKLMTPIIDKPQSNLDQEALKSILNKEIELPIQIPELYLVKVKKTKLLTGDVYDQWYLIGRYQGDESDVDETRIGAGSGEFAAREFFYTFGEVDEDLVKLLRPYEVAIDGLPKMISDGPFKNDLSFNQPMRFDEISQDDSEAVRKIDPKYIEFFWDPSQKRIFPGFYNPENPGEVILLHYGNAWRDIDNERIFQNRELPLIDANPKAISDVTEVVTDLIRRGYTTASIFGLKDPAFTAGLAINMETYIDYSDLSKILNSPNFLNNGVIYIGEKNLFQANFNDNSYLIFAKGPDLKPTKIFHFINGDGREGFIELTHDIILRLIRIKKLNVDGKEGYYGIIAVNSENENDFYAVPMNSVFNVGADSDIKVFAENVLKIAPWLVAAYGVYRIIKAMGPAGATLDSVGKAIGDFILKLFNK